MEVRPKSFSVRRLISLLRDRVFVAVGKEIGDEIGKASEFKN